MNKLPKELYQNMMCYNDGKFRQKNKRYLLGKEICNEDYKYRTIDIISYKDNNTENGINHHYKITFKDYYRLSGVNGDTKIIHFDLFNNKWNGSTLNCSEYQQTIDYICKVMKIKSHKYDSMNIYQSISNTIKTPSIDDNWRWKSLSNRRVHFICKDLNSEDLDSIIYPDEYKHFKYENN